MSAAEWYVDTILEDTIALCARLDKKYDRVIVAELDVNMYSLYISLQPSGVPEFRAIQRTWFLTPDTDPREEIARWIGQQGDVLPYGEVV